MEPRPNVSQIVLNTFAKIVDSQDDKGIKKYNRTIDDASDADYDWEIMALEEAADLQKYLVKKIIQLKAENLMMKRKPWMKVFQENLELAQENHRLRDLLEQNHITF